MTGDNFEKKSLWDYDVSQEFGFLRILVANRIYRNYIFSSKPPPATSRQTLLSQVPHLLF